jgi:hypothetical protein
MAYVEFPYKHIGQQSPKVVSFPICSKNQSNGFSLDVSTQFECRALKSRLAPLWRVDAQNSYFRAFAVVLDRKGISVDYV